MSKQSEEYCRCERCDFLFFSHEDKPYCPSCAKKPRLFDVTKPVETTDGRRAEILCLDFNGYLLARVLGGDGKWYLPQFTQDGISISGQASLINVPVRYRREFWINHYADGIPPDAHPSKQQADDCAGEYRICCLRHEDNFHEGYGV